MNKKYNEDTELLIDLLTGALQEEGYEIFRYYDSKKHYTTAYDTLEIKRHDNVYFNITIDKRETHKNPYTNEIYKDSEIFESLQAESIEISTSELQ